MKKILFISNISLGVGSFSIASLMAAKFCGFEFAIAANFNPLNREEMNQNEEKYDIKLHQIDFDRNPINKRNIRAFSQLYKLVKKEKYDIIHCNTPVGGLVGRLVARKCKINHVIYQAHGFHFYKGAPKFNWLIYYPIERWLAHYTDSLITINKEDYECASQKFKLRNNGNVYYIPGVGIDTTFYKTVKIDKKIKREQLGLNQDDLVLICAGRLDANKNNSTLIKAISLIENVKIHLLVCGDGVEKDKLLELAKELNIENQIHFLGLRNDMIDLYKCADIFVMASYREGLSRSIMEAMASGLPCIVSNIRGNIDLIKNNKGGYVVKPDSAHEFADKIKVLHDIKKRTYMSSYNLEKIKEFDIKNIINKIAEVYGCLGKRR